MVRQNPGMQRESLWGVSFALTEGMFQSPAPISRSFHEAKEQEVRVWWLAPDVVGLGLGQQMSGGVLAPRRGAVGPAKPPAGQDRRPQPRWLCQAKLPPASQVGLHPPTRPPGTRRMPDAPNTLTQLHRHPE